LLIQLAKVYSLQGSLKRAGKLLQSASQNDVDKAGYSRLLSQLFAGSSPTKPTDLPPWLTLYDEFFPDQVRLEEILDKVPAALTPLSLLVRMLMFKGEYAQAEFYLQRALTVEPGNTLAQNFFAEILIKQNQYSKAVVHLNQIIRSQPDWWVAYRNKSFALVKEGDTPRAIQTYKKGIKLSQETAVLRLDLALLYEKNGQAAEAVTVYEYMLRENQQAYEASNNLAMLLSDAEIFANGLPRAKELIKALEGEDNPAYLDTIGWVQLKSGDIDSALLALTHAAKKAPNIAMIQYHLGKAYLQAGNQASAHRQLQRAIRLNASFDERADAMALLQNIKSSTSTASVPESID
jgi:tetratricopeptide (TPR) repeat protein